MNEDQKEYWNADAGDFWAKEADTLDGILEPFLQPVLSGLNGSEPTALLDIGCGAGALTLAAKEAFPAAQCTGLDVSHPMLQVAKARAAAAGADVKFIEGDATLAELDTLADAMISRYGIMFFEDPVDAFTKLHALMRSGGRFSAVCWQEMPKNAWLAVPMMSAIPLLKEPPQPPDPHAPGPFAFADKARVLSIFKAAGWRDVSMERWHGKLRLPGSTLDEAGSFMTTLGPVASLIKEQELDADPIKLAVMDAIKDECGAGGPFELDAASWIVTATA
ncbi:MAG: methyltransferase domain-containing protein [Pseudomonadota bacterium]